MREAFDAVIIDLFFLERSEPPMEWMPEVCSLWSGRGWYGTVGRIWIAGFWLRSMRIVKRTESEVLGRGEVPRNLEVSDELTPDFVSEDVVDAGRPRFLARAVPSAVGAVRMVVLAWEASRNVGPPETLGVLEVWGVVEVDVGAMQVK